MGRHLELLATTGLLLVPLLLIGFSAPTSQQQQQHDRASFLLAPHLCALQSHEAGEGIIIETGGAEMAWLMFAYTCLANGLRLVSLATWWHRLLLYERDYDDGPEDDAMTQAGSFVGVMMVLLPFWCGSIGPSTMCLLSGIHFWSDQRRKLSGDFDCGRPGTASFPFSFQSRVNRLGFCITSS